MSDLARAFGKIHFVGIGGIGMSGIAEVMHNLGYTVQGSDLNDNANVQRLRALGIHVFIGQRAENLAGAACIVISSAVREDNPEVVAARAAKLPVVRRADMLAELMRLKSCIAIAGTHGKTTTTSLVAALLDTAGYDPTVINGGIINAYGTNAYLGGGAWMVVEADESDGTFIKLPATVAVVTNIDPEHLDHYGDFDTLRNAFRLFVEQVPFYGFAVLCIDHPEVQALLGRVRDRRVVTYGMSPQADVQVGDLEFADGRSVFSVTLSDRVKGGGRRIDALALPMPGRHNVLNAAAAITVACEMGVPDDKIIEGLARFGGVKRRFEHTGTWNGVAIYDDYAHHPVEIAAVLAAARASARASDADGRIIAVVQPHRYTRLRDLFEDFCTCFNDADAVLVADVYAAGEAPIDGYDAHALVHGLIDHGHKNARVLASPDDLPDVIAADAARGDMVVCLGAGSITQWASALPRQLAERPEGV